MAQQGGAVNKSICHTSLMTCNYPPNHRNKDRRKDLINSSWIATLMPRHDHTHTQIHTEIIL